MVEDNNPIIVNQTFNTSADELWKTITDVSEMRHWFFNNIPDFRAEEGFCTEFNVSSGERNFLHQWRIIEVIKYKKIVYDWSYDEYEGRGLVVFELSEDNNQTKLSETSHGMDSFTADIPEFKRESCIGGWNYFIRQNLKDYVSNK